MSPRDRRAGRPDGVLDDLHPDPPRRPRHAGPGRPDGRLAARLGRAAARHLLVGRGRRDHRPRPWGTGADLGGTADRAVVGGPAAGPGAVDVPAAPAGARVRP